LQAELDALVREVLVSRWRSNLTDAHYQTILDRLVEREIAPYQAVEELCREVDNSALIFYA
jgi:hypothetical protein